MSDTVPAGSVWAERRTGRRVVILAAEVHGTGPAWAYVRPDGRMDGWHYCDVFDFVVWGRFERVD